MDHKLVLITIIMIIINVGSKMIVGLAPTETLKVNGKPKSRFPRG